MKFVIRPLRLDEIECVSRMLSEVFSRPGVDPGRFVPAVQRHWALQSDGWFVAESEGTVVGGAAAIQYGSFAYLGPMVVRSAHRRQGIGRALVEHVLARLDDRSVPLVLLDATSDDGASLYERIGFIHAGLSHDYSMIPVIPVGPPKYRVQPCGAQFDGVVELDAVLFGARRSRLLRTFLNDDPNRVLAAVDGGGRVTGYAIAQPSVIGPIGADHPDIAEALLDAALALPYAGPVRVLVPGANLGASEALVARGFQRTRTAHHMRRGPTAVRIGNWDRLFGKASFAWG